MEGRKCDGNCLGCSFQQQTYCSAQRTYALLKNQEAMFSHIGNLEEALAAMKTAFERFGGEGKIINPFEKVESPKEAKEDEAQNGGGAEE